MTPPPLDDTKRRLLEAAGQVFAEKGRDHATVRDILKRAGMKNIAAVNYYFENKEKLYEAVLRHAFKNGLDELPRPAWLPEAPAEDKLRWLVRAIACHMLKDRDEWHMHLLMRELSSPSEAGRALVRDFIRPIYEALWLILRELLGPDMSEEKMHLIGFSIIGQIFYQRVGRSVLPLVVGEAEHSSYTPEVLAEHIADFSLAALGRRKAKGRAK